MTVAELLELLENAPPDAEVCIDIKNKAVVADDTDRTVYRASAISLGVRSLCIVTDAVKDVSL